MGNEMADFVAMLVARYPAETEFHQAVREVAKSVWPFIAENPQYQSGTS